MNRFTHFELVTDNIEKTAAFYRDVFGWQFEKWEGPIEYWMVSTGNGDTPGINGGLMKAGGPFTGTVNTLQVEDIDVAIAKILAHGGEIVFDKDVIPGVGYQAYFKDSTGVICGLHQADEKAGLSG